MSIGRDNSPEAAVAKPVSEGTAGNGAPNVATVLAADRPAPPHATIAASEGTTSTRLGKHEGVPPPDQARASALRRGRRLEFFTLGWNATEAVVAIVAGSLAGSVSLIGFGIDSVIESLSGGVLLWRLRDGERGEQREQLALRLVGVSFLLLATYVTVEAVSALVFTEAPDASVVGIVLAAVSLVVMPILARRKRSVAAELGSEALRADSKQTDICAYLSAILLGGLGLNALVGWWWADPVAALVMVPIIAIEGVRALRGETCDDCGAVCGS